MKKGIKKGHCLRHGLLNEENSLVYKEGDTVRIRCKICRRNNQQVKEFKRILDKCYIHGEKPKRASNGQCQECKNDWNRLDRKRNAKKYSEQAKIRKDKNRDKFREYEVLRVHGVTKEHYQKMILEQNNLCAICNRPERRIGRGGKDLTRLCIDHCHKSLKIRGLLCHDCNTAIGKMEDNIPRLESAILYLRRHEDG